MALTLEAEQRLQKVKLVELFDQHQADWQAAAQRTYDFIRAAFPNGSMVRPDDVAKALKPILEVNAVLQAHISAKKLTQKYWVTDFTDLIIERVWGQISNQQGAIP